MNRNDLNTQPKGNSGSDEVYNSIGNIRSGFWLRPYVGIQWEEYFSKHWGYRIGLTYSLRSDFSPSRYEIYQDIRDGVKYPDEVVRYPDDWDRLGLDQNESIEHIMYDLNVSIAYRW
jgi:hypothetical protein